LSARPGVQRLRPAENAPPRAEVPTLRVASPSSDDSDQDAPVAPSALEGGRTPRRHLLPAAEAWKKITSALRSGQGFRAGFLGVSGAGKTTSAVDLLRYLEAQHLAHLVIVHDVKLPLPQFEGRIEHEADAVVARPPEEYPATIVLRRKGLDHVPSVERAARVTLHASYSGVPTVFVLDELSHATTKQGKEFTAPSVERLISEGRGIGASIVWLAQLPQRVPTPAYDQSFIVLHRSGRKVLNYLVDGKILDGAAADVVARLPIGQFVLATAEEDFDGQIYETPAP
jgi:hypothetical protein